MGFGIFESLGFGIVEDLGLKTLEGLGFRVWGGGLGVRGGGHLVARRREAREERAPADPHHVHIAVSLTHTHTLSLSLSLSLTDTLSLPDSCRSAALSLAGWRRAKSCAVLAL